MSNLHWLGRSQNHELLQADFYAQVDRPCFFLFFEIYSTVKTIVNGVICFDNHKWTTKVMSHSKPKGFLLEKKNDVGNIIEKWYWPDRTQGPPYSSALVLPTHYKKTLDLNATWLPIWSVQRQSRRQSTIVTLRTVFQSTCHDWLVIRGP